MPPTDVHLYVGVRDVARAHLLAAAGGRKVYRFRRPAVVPANRESIAGESASDDRTDPTQEAKGSHDALEII